MIIKRSRLLKKYADFPLTRIILGILVVGGAVAFGEWSFSLFFGNFPGNPELLDWINTLWIILLALSSYILFFRFVEKRRIRELQASDFAFQAGFGFLLGITIQSVIIGILYLVGDYTILIRHPLSFLIPGLTDALVAGFVAEILLQGVLFRLAEEKMGTGWTVALFVLLFGFIHSGKDATFYSVLAVALQAGLLASATYVYSRSLWVPIFLHFARDYAEPGIFGGINTGISLKKSLITPRISGNPLLSGGPFGPSDSLVAAFLCLVVAALLLMAAKKKGRFIPPYWKRDSSSVKMGKAQL